MSDNKIQEIQKYIKNIRSTVPKPVKNLYTSKSRNEQICLVIYFYFSFFFLIPHRVNATRRSYIFIEVALQ